MFLLLDADEKVGWGSAREVYKMRAPQDDCVVKLESKSYSFQNVREWNVWETVKETKFAKWFAPCVSISPNGSVLIQRKTTPVPSDMWPEKVPCFLTDLKRANFGMYEGRLVCHDYGLHLLMENGMTTRLKKANWRDE